MLFLTRVTITTALILSWPIAKSNSQNLIHISNGDQSYIGKKLEIFVDSTRQLSSNEISKKTFHPSQEDVLNFGLDRLDNVWLKFEVESKTDEDVFLEIRQPMLDKLELYKIQNDSLVQFFSGSTNLPFSQKQIVSPNWIFNLHLKRGEQSKFYIMAHSVHPFDLPIKLYTNDKIIESNLFLNLFWGIYIGVMLFAFIYNLVIGIFLWERVYLYYIIYLMGLVIFNLGLKGFAYLFLWPNLPVLNNYFHFLLNVAITPMLILFTLKLLEVPKRQRYPGNILITAFITIGIIYISGLYAGIPQVKIDQLLNTITLIYLLLIGVLAIKRTKVAKFAVFFLVGWIVFIITGIILIMENHAFIPYNFFTANSFYVGHIIEVLLFSLALAHKINLLKIENSEKQKIIISQLEENAQIQILANKALEEKVRERTSELERATMKAESESKKSNRLLSNILPEEIANELKINLSAEPEKKSKGKAFTMVTVMFTDFKGFTKISESTTAEVLVDELDICFREFDEIMKTHRIEKLKTIGDSYMCVGGLPTYTDTHVSDVINAAFEIRKFMLKRKKENDRLGKISFEMRVGIHTGPVVAGVVGKWKYTYDVWGDTVNKASRMESNGEPGKINISEATYKLIIQKYKDKFNCIDRGLIETKDKDLLHMYFVEPI